MMIRNKERKFIKFTLFLSILIGSVYIFTNHQLAKGENIKPLGSKNTSKKLSKNNINKKKTTTKSALKDVNNQDDLIHTTKNLTKINFSGSKSHINDRMKNKIIDDFMDEFQLTKTFSNQLDSASAQLEKVRDQISPKEYQLLKNYNEHIFNPEELTAKYRKLLNEEFSLKEIKDLLEMYQTPLWKKVISEDEFTLSRTMESLIDELKLMDTDNWGEKRKELVKKMSELNDPSSNFEIVKIRSYHATKYTMAVLQSKEILNKDDFSKEFDKQKTVFTKKFNTGLIVGIKNFTNFEIKKIIKDREQDIFIKKEKVEKRFNDYISIKTKNFIDNHIAQKKPSSK